MKAAIRDHLGSGPIANMIGTILVLVPITGMTSEYHFDYWRVPYLMTNDDDDTDSPYDTGREQ